MEILEVFIYKRGGRWRRSPSMVGVRVRARRVSFVRLASLSCVVAASRAALAFCVRAGSARVHPYSPFSIAWLEEFFSAPPGRFKGVLISRRSPGAADSFLSLLN